MKYDVVVLHKYYDDSAYEQVQRWKSSGTRVIFDICDNRLYNPHHLPEWEQLGNQLKRMLAIADQVVASTETLSRALRAECPDIKDIKVIGDALDDLGTVPVDILSRVKVPLQTASVMARVRALRKNGHTALLWFGNHGSPYAEGGMLDLAPLRDAMESLHRETPLSLTIVSNSSEKFDLSFSSWNIPCFYLPWHPLSFNKIAREHDISIIPIKNNDFTNCKTDNRVVTSLVHGLAVVANPIPSYLPYAQVAKIGDIISGVRHYTASPDLRRQESTRGKALVEKTRDIQRIADQWQDLLQHR